MWASLKSQSPIIYSYEIIMIKISVHKDKDRALEEIQKWRTAIKHNGVPPPPPKKSTQAEIIITVHAEVNLFYICVGSFFSW